MQLWVKEAFFPPHPSTTTFDFPPQVVFQEVKAGGRIPRAVSEATGLKV